MTPAIKREMRRRAAIEPVIGHIKNEHRMGRNYLAHSQGDTVNAILAAAGYNFRLLLNWLRFLLRLFLALLTGAFRPLPAWKSDCSRSTFPFPLLDQESVAPPLAPHR